MSLNPRHDTSSLTDSQLHELTLDPYDEAEKYTRGVIYFFIAGIAVHAGLRALHALRASKKHTLAFANSNAYQKAAAAGRYLSSKQQRIPGLTFPTLGVGLLIVAFYAFTMSTRIFVSIVSYPPLTTIGSLDMEYASILYVELERRESTIGD